MGRSIGIAFGLVMIVAGTIWTLQGLDVMGGSAMSGNHTWAIVGPVVAGLGVALLIVMARPRQ
jgi:hypothetical protein